MTERGGGGVRVAGRAIGEDSKLCGETRSAASLTASTFSFFFQDNTSHTMPSMQ